MQIELFHFLHVYSVFNVAGRMLNLWTFICCLSLTVRNWCHYLFKLPPPLFILCMLSLSLFLDFNYFHVQNLILSLYFECSTFKNSFLDHFYWNVIKFSILKSLLKKFFPSDILSLNFSISSIFCQSLYLSTEVHHPLIIIHIVYHFR